MAKVIMTCGRLCSGKSTYAKKLSAEEGGVILSIDALMLALFPDGAGDKHDLYVARARAYLSAQAAALAEAGVTLILDWGLWTRAERTALRAFFREKGVPCEIHYVCPDEAEWRRRIEKRNAARPDDAYYVDEGLLNKAEALFEEPSDGEADRIVRI